MTRVSNAPCLGKMLLGFVGLVILTACSTRAPEPQRDVEESATGDQSSESQRADASQPSPSAAKAVDNRQDVDSSAPITEVPKQSVAPPKKPQTVKSPEDVVLLKASLGTVRFEHKKHSDDRKIACEACHHASRPEHATSAPQEACGMCHTPIVKSPMKTKLQAAFHNPTATAGICIDCHKTENAKGKSAPVKCVRCHKKEAA